MLRSLFVCSIVSAMAESQGLHDRPVFRGLDDAEAALFFWWVLCLTK